MANKDEKGSKEEKKKPKLTLKEKRKQKKEKAKTGKKERLKMIRSDFSGNEVEAPGEVGQKSEQQMGQTDHRVSGA